MEYTNWPLSGLRDPVSASSHALGFLWAVFATLVVVRLCRDNRPRQVALAVFGLSMAALYAASAVYHAVVLPPEQIRFFLLLDHSAIYLLIAGTHTPVFEALLSRRVGGVMLSVIWLLAACGIACQWLLPSPPYGLKVAIYVAMGWIAAPALGFLIRAVGFRGFLWLAYGGLAYTSGAVLDLIGWPVVHPEVFGPHELFHLLVLVGTYCHFVFITRYVVPYTRPAEGDFAEESLEPPQRPALGLE